MFWFLAGFSSIFSRKKKKQSRDVWVVALFLLFIDDTVALGCILNGYCNLATAKSLQSCPTLCDPIDGSPLGSSVPGILQARILEWVAISCSNAWKWKVKVKSLSRALVNCFMFRSCASITNSASQIEKIPLPFPALWIPLILELLLPLVSLHACSQSPIPSGLD